MSMTSLILGHGNFPYSFAVTVWLVGGPWKMEQERLNLIKSCNAMWLGDNIWANPIFYFHFNPKKRSLMLSENASFHDFVNLYTRKRKNKRILSSSGNLKQTCLLLTHLPSLVVPHKCKLKKSTHDIEQRGVHLLAIYQSVKRQLVIRFILS